MKDRNGVEIRVGDEVLYEVFANNVICEVRDIFPKGEPYCTISPLPIQQGDIRIQMDNVVSSKIVLWRRGKTGSECVKQKGLAPETLRAGVYVRLNNPDGPLCRVCSEWPGFAVEMLDAKHYGQIIGYGMGNIPKLFPGQITLESSNTDAADGLRILMKAVIDADSQAIRPQRSTVEVDKNLLSKLTRKIDICEQERAADRKRIAQLDRTLSSDLSRLRVATDDSLNEMKTRLNRADALYDAADSILTTLQIQRSTFLSEEK